MTRKLLVSVSLSDEESPRKLLSICTIFPRVDFLHLGYFPFGLEADNLVAALQHLSQLNSLTLPASYHNQKWLHVDV